MEKPLATKVLISAPKSTNSNFCGRRKAVDASTVDRAF